MKICSKSGVFVASDLIDSVWDQDCQEEDESWKGKHQKPSSDPTFQKHQKVSF